MRGVSIVVLLGCRFTDGAAQVVIYNQRENIPSPSEGTRGNATTVSNGRSFEFVESDLQRSRSQAGKGKGSWEIVARKKSCRVQGLD